MSDRLEKLLAFHDSDPNDTFSTYGIAMEYQKSGKPDLAIEWFDKTIAIDDAYAYAYYQKGQTLLQQGKSDQARQVVESGIEAASRSGDSHAVSELNELLESISGSGG